MDFLNLFKKFHHDDKGNILLFVITFGVIGFALTVGAVSSYAIAEHHASERKQKREMGFQIAEAGLNYYRWHLAHNKSDYYDGHSSTSTGPYVHEYKDKNGNLIGYFSLDITAPQNGSTVVKIASTGWHKDYAAAKRTVTAQVGFPSLTDYSLLTNTDVWIGNTESTHGKFHSNGGIRFDGTGDAQITSAVPTYVCKSYHGCNNVTKNGVWGSGGPTNLWQFPVPALDFDVVTVKLSEIKEQALDSGLYFPSSGDQGWHLIFQSNGTVLARKVISTNCYKALDVNASDYAFYCLDIQTQGATSTYTIPNNGYIFVDDMVWVDGTIDGRITVGTGEDKDIMLNGNLLYLAKDATDVLGLIASRDILIPRDAPTNLEVDAALLAQTGAAKRYYYSSNIKNQITIYGAVISAGIWTWNWSDGYGNITSGYRTTNSVYDVNLTYNPPPGFPVGSEYNLITWNADDN